MATLRVSLIILALVVPTARAGEHGCQPDSETYTFYRTIPPPPDEVGTGKFGSDAVFSSIRERPSRASGSRAVTTGTAK
jgi:hypothetical protein